MDKVLTLAGGLSLIFSLGTGAALFGGSMVAASVVSGGALAVGGMMAPKAPGM